MNDILKDKYGKDRIIRGIYNYQVVLNNELIDSTGFLNKNDIIDWVISYLMHQEALSRVFATDDINNTVLNSKQKEMLVNGYYPQRSGTYKLFSNPAIMKAEAPAPRMAFGTPTIRTFLCFFMGGALNTASLTGKPI